MGKSIQHKFEHTALPFVGRGCCPFNESIGWCELREEFSWKEEKGLKRHNKHKDKDKENMEASDLSSMHTSPRVTPRQQQHQLPTTSTTEGSQDAKSMMSADLSDWHISTDDSDEEPFILEGDCEPGELPLSWAESIVEPLRFADIMRSTDVSERVVRARGK